MKHVYSFLLLLFIIIIYSCQKKPAIINEVIIRPKTVYAGLYVNKFDTIFNDTAKENTLLRWAKLNNFNALTLYGLGNVLPTAANYPQLANFILRAKSAPYNLTEVNAARGKATDFTGLVSAYNNSRSNYLERFNVANLEREFWNDPAIGNTFSYTVTQLQNIKSWGLTQNPVVPTEEYIGWLRDSSNAIRTPTRTMQIADSLVRYTDRLLIHDYETTPGLSYVQKRLDTIGLMAIAQGKVQQVAIIFSAENVFSGSYFNVNPFVNAYNVLENANNAASYPGKAGIKFVGYQVYNYSHAKAARP